jgi:hypothetical protein
MNQNHRQAQKAGFQAMANHNGNNVRPMFARNERVPIVGQAFTLLEVVPVTTLVCNCEAKKVVTIAGLGTPAKCSGCGKAYVAMSAESVLDQATGHKNHNAQIAMMVPRAPDAPPPASPDLDPAG